MVHTIVGNKQITRLDTISLKQESNLFFRVMPTGILFYLLEQTCQRLPQLHQYHLVSPLALLANHFLVLKKSTSAMRQTLLK